MSENHVIVACPYSYPFGSRYELEEIYRSKKHLYRHLDTLISLAVIASSITTEDKIHYCLGRYCTRTNLLHLMHEYSSYGKEDDSLYLLVTSEGYCGYEGFEDNDSGGQTWTRYIVDEARTPVKNGAPLSAETARNIRTTTYTYAVEKYDTKNQPRKLYKEWPMKCNCGTEVVDLVPGTEMYNRFMFPSAVKKTRRIPVYYPQEAPMTWEVETSCYSFYGLDFEVIFVDYTSEKPYALLYREDKTGTGEFTSYLPHWHITDKSSLFETYSTRDLLDGEYNVITSEDIAEFLFENPVHFFMFNACSHGGMFGTGLIDRPNKDAAIWNVCSADEVAWHDPHEGSWGAGMFEYNAILHSQGKDLTWGGIEKDIRKNLSHISSIFPQCTQTFTVHNPSDYYGMFVRNARFAHTFN